MREAHQQTVKRPKGHFELALIAGGVLLGIVIAVQSIGMTIVAI